MDQLELKFEWTVPAGNWSFWVNGSALEDLFPESSVGLITGFLSPNEAFARAYLERLLGAPSEEAPEGRTPLLICKECGDIGCGAITVKVDTQDNKVIWSDFWWEADYEEFDSRPHPDLRFEFDRLAYETVLRGVYLR